MVPDVPSCQICNWTCTKQISMVVYMAQPATWPVQRFRATLDRILDETGLPQAGLAALVPMDQSQLSRWKSGSSRPKFESLKILGEALRAKYPSLGIGANELLESAGYAPPEPVVHVSQVSIEAQPEPPPGAVTFASGNSPPVTVVVDDSTRGPVDPRDTAVGELRDQFERMAWAGGEHVPVGLRVAAILGYRQGMVAIGAMEPDDEQKRPPA